MVRKALMVSLLVLLVYASYQPHRNSSFELFACSEGGLESCWAEDIRNGQITRILGATASFHWNFCNAVMIHSSSLTTTAIFLVLFG